MQAGEDARKWELQPAEAEPDPAEQARPWQEDREDFQRVHEEIVGWDRRFDRGIGALGARWGMPSETASRNALAEILEENFDVQALNGHAFDDQGVVFGRPEQVELDILVEDGVLASCARKS